MSYDDDYASKALPRPPLDHLEWMHTPYSPFFKDDYITYSYFLTGGSWLQPYEFTGWRDEQLSSRKTCFIHAYLNPNNLYRYSGPDAKKYLSKYFTNSFEKFPIGSGKHGIACNEEGNVITDGVMLRTGENEYEGFFWFNFFDMQGDSENFDLEIEELTSGMFLFQVCGPRSLEVLETASGEDLHDIKFMRFREFSINGKPIRLLRAGMAGSLGYELHGNFADAGEIYEAIYNAGRNFGIRRLGIHAYSMLHAESGFSQFGFHFLLDVPFFLEYFGRAGSHQEAGVDAYKHHPFELGWGYGVSFDHDFVGREALEKIKENPARKMVSLEWNKEDILEIHASQYEDGEPYQDISEPTHMNPLDTRIRHDKVLKDGELVGISTGRTYSVYYQRMMSLCFLDTEYAEEGTEVCVVWGEPGTRQKEIRATVTRFPYYNEFPNQSYDVNQIPRLTDKK